MSEPLNVTEFEAIARERLDRGVYDYYAGGADDEVTLAGNREAFRRIPLRFRVLVDVSERDLRAQILGIPLAFPVLLAPTALHRMAHPDGELATARAAAAAGTLMTLSTISSTSLEEVHAAAPDGPRWFQLYHYSDMGKTEELVARASASGYRAIVLTVDAPILGRRERDLRNPFALPEGIEAVHFGPVPLRSASAESPLSMFIDQPSVTWEHVRWVRSLTPLPVILKGIVRGDDAKRAIDEGASGVWVSNHGGRQLDTSIPTAHALPDVVQAVAGQVPIVVDGGIRRGTDVLKALALGADAVAVGRPQLWGLAAGGEQGVRAVLEMYREELSLAMALAGCRSLGEIDRDLLG